MLMLGLAMLFAFGDPAGVPPSSDGLVWTAMPDPDPHYVPPPPEPATRARPTPRHIKVVPPSRSDDFDESQANALREFRRLDRIIANTCRSVRESGIDAPACKGH